MDVKSCWAWKDEERIDRVIYEFSLEEEEEVKNKKGWKKCKKKKQTSMTGQIK